MRRVQTRWGGGWRRMASSSPFSVVNIARICCLRHFMPAGKMDRKYFIKILICNCKNILEPDWKYFIIINILEHHWKYFINERKIFLICFHAADSLTTEESRAQSDWDSVSVGPLRSCWSRREVTNSAQDWTENFRKIFYYQTHGLQDIWK